MDRLLSLDDAGARDPAVVGRQGCRARARARGGVARAPRAGSFRSRSPRGDPVGAERARDGSGSAARGVPRRVRRRARRQVSKELRPAFGRCDGEPASYGPRPRWTAIRDGRGRSPRTSTSPRTSRRRPRAAGRRCSRGMRPSGASDRCATVVCRSAVLLQPYVGFELGGAATVDAWTGTIRPPRAAPGGLRPDPRRRRSGRRRETTLTAGGRGRCRLRRRRRRGRGPVVRSAHRGRRSIEWGVASGGVCPPAGRTTCGVGRPTRAGAAARERPRRRCASRWPPPVFAVPSPKRCSCRGPRHLSGCPDPTPLKVADAAGALREARELAEALMSSLGCLDASARSSRRATCLGRLRPEAGFRRVRAALRPVAIRCRRGARRRSDRGRRPQVVGGGSSAAPGRVWRCRADEFERRRRRRVPAAGGPRSLGAVRLRGRGRARATRAPARRPRPGSARAERLVDSGPERRTPRAAPCPRLPAPVPHVAPLLWECAAVVSRATASAGAHLFEVARSWGVPAVVGVDLDGMEADALVAVDGNTGRVTTWHPSELERAQRGA